MPDEKDFAARMRKRRGEDDCPWCHEHCWDADGMATCVEIVETWSAPVAPVAPLIIITENASARTLALLKDLEDKFFVAETEPLQWQGLDAALLAGTSDD